MKKFELCKAVEDQKTTLAELKQFSNKKTELAKPGISFRDVPRLVEAMRCMRELYYDVDRVVIMISNLEAFSAMLAVLEDVASKTIALGA